MNDQTQTKAPMNAVTAISFDFDGTLVDSAPSILAGFDFVLREAGIAPSVPLTTSIIGPPLAQTLQILSGISDPEQLRAMAAAFKTFYDADACLQSVPYPGVGEGLAALRARGLKLHVATNKRLFPTLRILDHLGWTSYFESIYALDLAERNFASKAVMLGAQLADFGLNAATTRYIGDRDEDRHAAEANGVGFIGVSWGYGQFAGASHPVVDSMDALLAAIA